MTDLEELKDLRIWRSEAIMKMTERRKIIKELKEVLYNVVNHRLVYDSVIDALLKDNINILDYVDYPNYTTDDDGDVIYIGKEEDY